jgi:hypothetical protein
MSIIEAGVLMEIRKSMENTPKRDRKIDKLDHHSNVQSRLSRTTTHKVDIGRVAAHELLATPK